MKRVFVIILLIAVVALVFFFTNNQFTGGAILTPRANYGPIDDHGNLYVNCIYLSDYEGWDVTQKGELKYFHRLKGREFIEEDKCISDLKIEELNCVDNFMMERDVICPSGMVCKDGACAYPSF